MPTEFDGWVFGIVSRAIPRLTPAENPDSLWNPILDLGPRAHDWVERFFWNWFTDGLQASGSPSNFVRVWRWMIMYAIASPVWDRSAPGSYQLDAMVIELLGLNARWGALAADEKFTPSSSNHDRCLRSVCGQVVPHAEGSAQFPLLPCAASSHATSSSRLILAIKGSRIL